MNANDKSLKCDLHIHTIYSSCYKQNDLSIEENIKLIINKCYDQGISVIAFTDHNSAHAYYKYLEIKKDLENNIKIAQEYNIEESKYSDKKALLQKFNYVNVLPGVEFDLNPGIHMVAIFNPKIEEIEINKIIEENGYILNDGISEGESKLDVIHFLDKMKAFDTIIFAPHIDSDKGIYKSIADAGFRSRILKHDSLKAVCCLNSDVQGKIKDLINTDNNYKRNFPLAFIQASDAHEVKEVGKTVTYIRAINSFEDIKKAFYSPERDISNIDNPNLINLVKSIIESKNYSCINSMAEFEKDFYKHIVAHFNNGYGNILVGISCDGSISGIKITKEELTKIVSNIDNKICTTNGFLEKPTIKIESLDDKKIVLLVYVINRYKSISYIRENNSETSYIFHNNNYKEAKIKDIVYLANQKILSSIGDHQIDNVKVLIGFMQDFTNIIGIPSSININSKIEKDFIKLSDLCKITKCRPYHNIKIEGNGNSDGNCIVVSDAKIRLDDTMLRCSAPQINIKNIGDVYHDVVAEPSIILVNNGGSYIIEECDIGKAIVFNQESYIITIKKEYTDKVSLYLLLFWLKSSCLLWYLCFHIHRDVNSSAVILEKTIFPKALFSIKTTVEKRIKEIIICEKDLLSKDLSKENAGELIIEHNSNVNKMIGELEDDEYKCFGISEEEVNSIENLLNGKHYFIYKKHDIKK